VSWCVTVNNIPEYTEFPVETQEFFAGIHPSYPRDAIQALALAKLCGLKSATLSGCRTPNPYGGDEIVDVSVRGTPIYNDFLSEMREIIATGPGAESALAKHYAALAILRGNPCSHVFDNLPDGTKRCLACQVYLSGTMFYFGE